MDFCDTGTALILKANVAEYSVEIAARLTSDPTICWSAKCPLESVGWSTTKQADKAPISEEVLRKTVGLEVRVECLSDSEICLWLADYEEATSIILSDDVFVLMWREFLDASTESIGVYMYP